MLQTEHFQPPEPPGAPNANPLDEVWDIIADLSDGEDVWVNMDYVESMAAQEACSSKMVQDAVESWEGLGALQRNRDKTMVKFMGAFAAIGARFPDLVPPVNPA